MSHHHSLLHKHCYPPTILKPFSPISSSTQMGCIKNLSFCPKIQNSTAFFIILLFLTSTLARVIPQGELNSKLIVNDSQVTKKEDEYYEESNVMVGSRPPRCEWKKYCAKCGKCEAIQVPIVSPRRGTHTNTRRDDISNYKPMCWKCKCGDFIFNP